VESSNDVDDLSLVEGTLAGRRQDFDLLVRRHQRTLFAFAYRFVRDPELAADIVQSSFILAYTRLNQFAQRSSFKTWLHQIVLNECRAAHRRTREHAHVPLDDVAEAKLADSATSEPELGSLGWKAMIERFVSRLPARQRSVLILRIFSDLPFKEIARVENISENSAKVSFHHAITRLWSWMEEKP